MGLDMMLYAREKGVKRDDAEKIGYWRKFNALHSYIVTEIGKNPESNCEYIEMLESDIDTLLEKLGRIKEILDGAPKLKFETNEWNGQEYSTWDYDKKTQNAVAKILAPQDGFFWGSTDINSFYYDNILSSIKIFIEAKRRAQAGQTIEYSSWW